MTYIVLTVKLVIFTLAIILLLVGFLKLTDGKLKDLSKGKYIKIIEKTPLSKTNNIYLLKLGDEGAVIVTNDKGATVLRELSVEEIEKIEKSKEENYLEMNKKYKDGLNQINLWKNSMLRKVKGEKNE